MGNKIGNYKISTDINDLYNYSNKNIEIIKGRLDNKKGIIIKIKNLKNNDNNLKESFNFKSFTNILNNNQNFIQPIDYSFINENNLISFFYFNERKKYQSFYSFFKTEKYYYLSYSLMKKIIIQLNEIIKIIFYNKFPFPFFNIYHFYYDKINNNIKYVYFTFFEKYFSDYDFYKNFSENLSNEKIKNIIPKEKYFNFNIGNFIFNLLFRESPNFNVVANKNGNKYYKLIIPDYKVIDFDKKLIDFLHFLLDFEDCKDNKNFNFLKIEEDNFNLYFSNEYFKENLSNKIDINYESKKYFFKNLNDNNKYINEINTLNNIHQNIKKYYANNNFYLLYNNFSLTIDADIIDVYNQKCEKIYSITEIKEKNYSYSNIFDLKNDYIIFYKSKSNLLHFILIKEKYYKYFFYEIPINLKNDNLEKYKKKPKINSKIIKNENKKKKKKKKKNRIELLKIDFNSSISDIDDDPNVNMEDYHIFISFLTSDNKLLIKRKINSKYEIIDLFFVLDLNDLNEKSNPKIQLVTIIEMGYIKNYFISENKKNKEIIMNIDDENIVFLDSNTFEKKLMLNFKKPDLFGFKKLGEEIIIIKYTNLIYILKNHNIIWTYYTSNNLYINYLILWKKNFILLYLQKKSYFYEEDEEEEDEKENYEKIGFVIYDDIKEFNSFNRKTVLLEIKENNFIVKHDVKEDIDFENYHFFKVNNNDNILYNHLVFYSRKSPDFKFYILEEEK